MNDAFYIVLYYVLNMAADPWSQLFSINIFYIIEFNVSKIDINKLLKYIFLLNNIYSKKTKTKNWKFVLSIILRDFSSRGDRITTSGVHYCCC